MVSAACANTASYYSALLPLSGESLRSALHTLIAGHTVVSYGDAWEALSALDEDSGDASRVRLVYSDTTLPKSDRDSGDNTGWNREHVWPRSFGVGQSGPDYSDLHALFPADASVNSARGNRYFDDCGGCLSPAHPDAAPDTAKDSERFRPSADERGNLARALFYMETRYDGEEPGVLDLTLAASPDPSAGVMANLNDLLAWHAEDPVDAAEAERNAAICANWQHNRNPFVDHPEWVASLFGGSFPPPPPPSDGGVSASTLLREPFDSSTGFSVVDATGAAVGFFSDGEDYFGINRGAGASDFGTGADDPPGGAPAYTGFSGGYLEAEDIDHGTGYDDPFTLTWGAVGGSCAGQLAFSGKFAEDGNAKIDTSDYVQVRLAIDGGAAATVLEFRGDGANGAYNGAFAEDTDGDGVGDGAALTLAAQMFSVGGLGAMGSGFVLSVVIRVEAGDEEIAMDDLQVSCVQAATPPPPGPSPSPPPPPPPPPRPWWWWWFSFGAAPVLIIGAGAAACRRRRSNSALPPTAPAPAGCPAGAFQVEVQGTPVILAADL